MKKRIFEKFPNLSKTKWNSFKDPENNHKFVEFIVNEIHITNLIIYFLFSLLTWVVGVLTVNIMFSINLERVISWCCYLSLLCGLLPIYSICMHKLGFVKLRLPFLNSFHQWITNRLLHWSAATMTLTSLRFGLATINHQEGDIIDASSIARIFVQFVFPTALMMHMIASGYRLRFKLEQEVKQHKRDLEDAESQRIETLHMIGELPNNRNNFRRKNLY